MKQIRKNYIKFHIIEPDLHKKNPAEVTIREISHKW